MISVKCQHCRVNYQVSDQFAGKRGDCPNCGNRISVPLIIDNERSGTSLTVQQRRETALGHAVNATGHPVVVVTPPSSTSHLIWALAVGAALTAFGVSLSAFDASLIRVPSLFVWSFFSDNYPRCEVRELEAFLVLKNLETVPLSDLEIKACYLNEYLRAKIDQLHASVGRVTYGLNEPPIDQARAHLQNLRAELALLQRNKDWSAPSTPKERQLENFIRATEDYLARKGMEVDSSRGNGRYVSLLLANSKTIGGSRIRTGRDGVAPSFMLGKHGPGPWLLWATTERLGFDGSTEDLLWIEVIPADATSVEDMAFTNRNLRDLASNRIQLPPPID